MDQVRKFVSETMAIPGVAWVVWGTVLLMLLAIAVYVVGRFRSLLSETAPDRESYLGTFRDLREQGLLEEEEFERLKQKIKESPPALTAGRPSSLPPAASAKSGPEMNQ